MLIKTLENLVPICIDTIARINFPYSLLISEEYLHYAPDDKDTRNCFNKVPDYDILLLKDQSKAKVVSQPLSVRLSSTSEPKPC